MNASLRRIAWGVIVGLAALAIAVLITGCGSAPVRTVGVPVEVPVAHQCRIALPSRPAWAVDALPLGASPGEAFRALRSERTQRIGYESELEAAIDKVNSQ